MKPRLEKLLIPLSATNHQVRHIGYTDWGDINNKNILFCVHGLSRNSRDFDYLAAHLQKHYRVICPDIAGRGRSDWLADYHLYNYETYIKDMKFLIDALGVKQVEWVGTSMGGYIGMFLEIAHPGTIKKLVLNDIGPHIPSITLKRISKYVGLTPTFRDVEHAKEHLKIILSPFGIKEESHWQHLASHSVMENGDGSLRLAYDPEITHAFGTPEQIEQLGDVNLWDMWDKLKCEIMLIRGEKSDILLPQTLTRMQEKSNVSKTFEVAGAGHAPSLLTPDQISEIEEWLVGKKSDVVNAPVM